MSWQSLSAAVLAGCCVVLAGYAAAQDAAGTSISYLAQDAPAGMSQAVVVRGLPLVYTRMLLPVDRQGKVVGEGSADRQVEQVLTNLEAVLNAAGTGLSKVVRLNVYALSHQTTDSVRERLSKRVGPSVRPAITTVLTPLPHRKALVAVDAIAAHSASAGSQQKIGRSTPGRAVTLYRCKAVSGEEQCADAAVLPPGGVAYVSGVPARSGLTVPAVTKSLAVLFETLRQLQVTPAQVVQLKVFLLPAASADEVLAEVKKFFPGQAVPPVVFVEWLASAPVEVELVAALPAADRPAAGVEFYNPPDVRPSAGFSRVALVRAETQIFTSSLWGRAPGDAEAQARDVFDQLQSILSRTGSDMLHLAKATYYVSDDEASKALDQVRPDFLDPLRPPAASKVTVHGVGRPGRTLSMDMIAVGGSR